MSEDSPKLKPWDWLAARVSLDGEGYSFVELHSPAGGRMPISDEDRRRIVACVNFLREFPTEFLEKHQAFSVAPGQRYWDSPGYSGMMVIRKNTP